MAKSGGKKGTRLSRTTGKKPRRQEGGKHYSASANGVQKPEAEQKKAGTRSKPFFHLAVSGIRTDKLGKTTAHVMNAKLRKEKNRRGIDYHTNRDVVYEVSPRAFF